MKKRMEVRPRTKRESREKQKLAQEQQALLEQWGVTEEELKKCWKRDGLTGREAAFEELVDYELCLDLAGRHARESAKKTGDAIGDVRDRYEAIALGFRCARGAQSSEAPLALGSALNALAEEFERDRKGLLGFLDAVFKRWGEIVRPLESIADTQPQLQPALLRLSAMISRWDQSMSPSDPETDLRL